MGTESMTTPTDIEALAAVERLRQAAFRPTELTPGLTVVGQYDLRAILAHIDALTAERDAAVAALAQRNAEIVASIPPELKDLLLKLGKAEWGTTHEHDAAGHGAHVRESVEQTAEHFGQIGPQKMHGLYLEGTDTVLCHIGTSPNSPDIARLLTGSWNWLCEIADAIEPGEYKENKDET
jgi:hypothetical protein